MANHPVLIAGEWRKAQSRRSFSPENPALGEKLPGEYPISDWADCDAALAAATAAAAVLRASPPDTIAALASEVDQIVCLSQPEPFGAIGAFYDDFRQLEDEDVRSILAATSRAGRGAAR